MYDNQNIFAKILRGEIPAKVVYQDDFALAFYDVSPRAKTHVLIIPKGEYTDVYDFSARATPEFQAGFWRAVKNTVDALNVCGNFRIVANTGAGCGQSVFHFHVHILS